MIKSDLVLRIAAENPQLFERDIERVVNAILGKISDALAAGDRVELRGLGAFITTERGARMGRNPRTGAAVAVETKRLPVFKPSKVLQARLNLLGSVTSAEMDVEVERLSGGS